MRKNENNRKIILNAAVQVYHTDKLARDIVSLYDSMEKLYSSKKNPANTQFCVKNGIKEPNRLEKIGKVLNGYNDDFTKEFLLTVIADYLVSRMKSRTVDRQGNVRDAEYFSAGMERFKHEFRDVLIYAEIFLSDDITEAVRAGVEKHFGGGNEEITRLLTERITRNANLMGEYATTESPDNRRYLAGYENDSEVYDIFRETVDDFLGIETLSANIFSFTSDIRNEKLAAVMNARVNGFFSRKEQRPESILAVKDIPKLSEVSFVAGLNEDLIAEKAKKKVSCNIAPQTGLRADIQHAVCSAVYLQISESILEVPDIMYLIMQHALSAAEKRQILNSAFLNVDAVMIGETADYKKHIPEIAHQIAGGFIALVIQKDRLDTMKRLLTKDRQKKTKAGKSEKPNLGERYISLTEENNRLMAEVQSLRESANAEKKRLKEENKELLGQIAERNARLRELEKEFEKIKENEAELREYINSIETEEIESHESVTEEDFRNAIVGKKILIWGLTSQVAGRVGEYPEITYVTTDKQGNSGLTRNQLMGYDGVIIATGHSSHGMYWDAKAIVKSMGLPFIHMYKTTFNADRIKASCIDLAERINAS